jgi:hypothetical protein
MSEEFDRTRLTSRGTALVSLVAIVACALATDALANPSPTEPSARLQERGLSGRVAAIVERLRESKATLVPALHPEVKIAQWRNY